MSETERLRIAIFAARDIKAAIDEVNARGVFADYPNSVTVDRQTFMWAQLVGELP